MAHPTAGTLCGEFDGDRSHLEKRLRLQINVAKIAVWDVDSILIGTGTQVACAIWFWIG